MVRTDQGLLAFQDYFVRLRCAPRVERLEFPGTEVARASAGLLTALAAQDLRAIIVCPSNPFLSILPILSIPSVRKTLEQRKAPLVAVSPIIGGAAVKGPAAKIMDELGFAVSSAGVAGFYGPLLDGFIIDTVDARLAVEIEGPDVRVSDTMMRNADDRRRLAAEALAFAQELARK
jgi:LPPG:FO 2-phospho-L-lactate transferase